MNGVTSNFGNFFYRKLRDIGKTIFDVICFNGHWQKIYGTSQGLLNLCDFYMTFFVEGIHETRQNFK